MKAWAGAGIRRKLLALVLLPLLGVLPVLGLILLWWGNSAVDEVLITKVRSDLAVARGYFERVRGEVGTGATTVAESHGLRRALGQGDAAQIERLLLQYRERSGLTFLNWRSPEGEIVVTDAGVPPPSEQRTAWASASARSTPGGIGLRAEESMAQVVIMDEQALAALAPAARERVGVPLVPTQGARADTRLVEDRAMVLLAQAPVRDEAGRVLGHIQAGVLLNRNLEFIDRINDIVYPEGALPFGSKGTATLFLDDVRISTNVRLFGQGGRDDSRAIGTRVSEVVHDAVLDQGRTWLDRAFVVNEWYVSAYEPITAADGQRVGMLYVGFLEQPFRLIKYTVLVAIGAAFFAVMVGAAWVSLRAARSIFRPVERMETTMRQVEAGDAQARVGPTGSEDELGRLAADLDHLLDSIAQQTRALQEWNAVLDARVAQRTTDLEQAQQRLVQTEKLAIVGQLTAGMAHEINNPIAVIQGNLDLLRQTLGERAAEAGTELRLIDQQIERMRLIVTQMLQFARPGEYAGDAETVDVDEALRDCLVLTERTLRRSGITVERDDSPGLQALINRQALQQVMVNLIVNAAHAMPGGGTLSVSSAASVLEDGRAAVAIAVADQGQGLPEAVRHDLFQPFVTHKKDGTGLGLWISRTIVQRHGGDIRAANRPAAEGRGAVFTVLLPSAALSPADRRPASPPG